VLFLWKQSRRPAPTGRALIQMTGRLGELAKQAAPPGGARDDLRPVSRMAAVGCREIADFPGARRCLLIVATGRRM
jgi:hypothetical protein